MTNDALLADLAAAVESHPHVSRAVAVVRKRLKAGGATPSGRTSQRGHAVDRQSQPAASADTADSAARGIVTGPMAEISGGDVRFPAGMPATLQEALRRTARETGERGTVYLAPDGSSRFQSYSRLLDEAQRVLAGLRAAGLRPGDAALFQFEDNQNYVTTFWACVLGGFVPTPVAVSPTYERHSAISRKLHNAWRLLGRPVLLTDRATLPALSRVGKLWEEQAVVALAAEDLGQSAPDTRWHPSGGSDPVLHLLTSGSTGVPKCVRHTNASVAARTYGTAFARGYGPDDVTMNWMPLDHVAIVMYNVRDVFLGCTHVNASVAMFLSNPLGWLDWIDHYRATNTWAPNFAYSMINDRGDDIAKARWDLSCMRAMTNAAEPIIASTSQRFLELLAPHGLPADALRPCWGMSETCSGVTYSRLDREDPGVGTLAADPSALPERIRAAEPGSGKSVVFTSVGRPIPGFRLRIVDDDGGLLPEDRIGQLQVSGEVMMQEYYGNAQASLDSRSSDGWFRTGDLAFVHDGALVITGRERDQIIVRGVNYLAHEIEAIVEEVPGVAVTYVAAAAIIGDGEALDQLALFFVPSGGDWTAVAQTVGAIRAKLVRDIGLSPDYVVPLSRDEFPKTSSGKIQRGQLAAELQAGTFDGRLHDIATQDSSDGPAIPPWFFERAWRPADADRQGSAPPDGNPPGGNWLVFDDGWWDGAGGGLAGPASVKVLGPAPGTPELDLVRHFEAARAGFRRQLASVRATSATADVVLIGVGLGDPDPDAGDQEAAVDVGHAAAARALNVLALIQELASGIVGEPMLLVLSRVGHSIVDRDRVRLTAAALPGLIRTAIAEAILPAIRQVDLPDARDSWPAAIAAELADRDTSGIVAYRDGERWVPRLRRAQADSADGNPPELAHGGLYLITGGLGGIGCELAQYLLAVYQARLLLIGRTQVDQRADGEAARRLADISELGEVEYVAVDVADEAGLRRAVDLAERRWGRPLDGAFHLAGAGVAQHWEHLEDHILARESADAFLEMYRSKVSGTLAIASVLESRPHALLVLFSSVNGDLGGSSFGAYSSANGFLTGFADYWQQRGRPVRCLAWSTWTDAGMNSGRSPAAAATRGFRPIGTTEGLASLLAALSGTSHHLLIGLDGDNPHVVAELAAEELSDAEILLAYTSDQVVSQADLAASIGIAARTCPVPLYFQQVSELPLDASGRIDTARVLSDAGTPGARGPRFTKPKSEFEYRLARAWAKTLNRPQVGRDQSFFHLGGSSMRAMQLVARINDEFGAELTLLQLYENPTVEELSAFLGGGVSA